MTIARDLMSAIAATRLGLGAGPGEIDRAGSDPQGYLISRPLRPDRFDAWLAARTVRAPGTRDETVLTLVP